MSFSASRVESARSSRFRMIFGAVVARACAGAPQVAINVAVSAHDFQFLIVHFKASFSLLRRYARRRPSAAGFPSSTSSGKHGSHKCRLQFSTHKLLGTNGSKRVAPKLDRDFQYVDIDASARFGLARHSAIGRDRERLKPVALHVTGKLIEVAADRPDLRNPKRYSHVQSVGISVAASLPGPRLPARAS